MNYLFIPPNIQLRGCSARLICKHLIQAAVHSFMNDKLSVVCCSQREAFAEAFEKWKKKFSFFYYLFPISHPRKSQFVYLLLTLNYNASEHIKE